LAQCRRNGIGIDWVINVISILSASLLHVVRGRGGRVIAMTDEVCQHCDKELPASG